MNPIQLRSEHIVVYSLLMKPELVHDIMSSMSSEMFQDQKNKLIFDCAVELYVEHNPIDTISIYRQIMKSPSPYKAEAKKDIPALISKFGTIPSAEFKDAMVYMIAESVRFEHKGIGEQVLQMSASEAYDPNDVLDFLQEHITNNKFKSLSKNKDFSNEDLLDELDEGMKKAREQGGINGIETGYKDFDKCTSGMHGTNLIIVAARPAMGKTQWALGAMKHASITNENKGVFFSCEMAEVQVMKRMVAIEGQIKGYSIKYGNLDKKETVALGIARENITSSNMTILAGSFNINDIVAKCHKLKNSVGLDYVVVDYIQKVHGTDKKNRNNEVEEVTGKLKDLANELDIPVIALAQLSRAVEQRPDKRPMLSDLRDSGAIEQDADIVLFLYRPSYYMEESEKSNNPMAKDGYLMIAKHRDGDLRDIEMRFEADIPAWVNKNDPPMMPVSPPHVFQDNLVFEDDSPSALEPNSSFDNDSLPF